MKIGSLDVPYSKYLQKKEQRKTYEKNLTSNINTRTNTKPDNSELAAIADNDFNDFNEPTRISTSNDDIFTVPSLFVKSSSQIRLSLPAVARVSRRYNLSERCIAQVASVLEDVGFLTKDDKTMIIDKNKVARERKKLEMELQIESSQKAQNLRGLYFDGRKDSSCTQILISDTKFSRTLVKEEHISLV